MSVKVKIIEVNDNWATIRYAHSSAKSRIKTDRLASDYQNGVLIVQNEEILEPYLNIK